MGHLILWSIFGIICCVQNSNCSKENWLSFGETKILNEISEPININTTEAKNIITKPLTYIVHSSEKVKLLNTGYSVEVILTSRFTSNVVFGGVLYNNVYVYSRQKYYFTPRKGEIASDTVDGKEGVQLVVCIYYYHIKYGSFDNALKHRDGIFETRVRVSVGGVAPNLSFITFEDNLKKIREPGSSMEMPIGPTYKYFNLLSPDCLYYAYPGSYRNGTKEKQFYSTTTILTVLPDCFISQQQFDDTFGSMLNTAGGQLNTAVKQVPAGDRPIVSTTGIREIPFPIGLFPSKPGRIQSQH